MEEEFDANALNLHFGLPAGIIFSRIYFKASLGIPSAIVPVKCDF
jgi:hypothetical protein